MASDGKNNNLKYSLISIGVVIVVFLIIIVAQSPTTPNLNGSDSLASSTIENDVSTVSTNVLNSIGTGTTISQPKAITGQSLTKNGKPEILYMGAEYCPYCAAERWSMAVSLARFGTFKNLEVTHSSASDAYPDTQTLSFYQSSYTSSYVVFTPVELYSNVAQGSGYATLMTPTSEQQSLMNTYDSAPYVSSGSNGAIPFIYMYGKYLITGANFLPSALQNKTATQIANSLNSTSNPIAKAVDGAANLFTAATCSITNNQPASACTMQIKAIEKTIE